VHDVRQYCLRLVTCDSFCDSGNGLKGRCRFMRIFSSYSSWSARTSGLKMNQFSPQIMAISCASTESYYRWRMEKVVVGRKVEIALVMVPKDQMSVGVPHHIWSCASGLRHMITPVISRSFAKTESARTVLPQSANSTSVKRMSPCP
jgi:hypothetical protein